MTCKQDFENYTSAQHSTWNFLYERQYANLKEKTSEIYLKTLNEMSSTLTSRVIPQISSMSDQLYGKTGWTIEIVPGLIPPEDFF